MAENRRFFSHNTDERLIAAVHRREPLWNPSSDLHKNSVVLKRLWNDIASELQKDVTTIKTRWKNLRAYFIKVHRKSDKPKDGYDQMSTITWQFYDQLAFLKCCTPGSERDSLRIENEDSNSTLDGTADEIVDNIDDKQNSESDSNSVISQVTKRKRPRISANATQRGETFELERSRNDVAECESFPERNDDQQFFESLLPYVQNIPLMRKLKLRCKIQEMILKELEAVENEIPQQQTRFTEVYIDNVPISTNTNLMPIKKEPEDFNLNRL